MLFMLVAGGIIERAVLQLRMKTFLKLIIQNMVIHSGLHKLLLILNTDKSSRTN